MSDYHKHAEAIPKEPEQSYEKQEASTVRHAKLSDRSANLQDERHLPGAEDDGRTELASVGDLEESSCLGGNGKAGDSLSPCQHSQQRQRCEEQRENDEIRKERVAWDVHANGWSSCWGAAHPLHRF